MACIRVKPFSVPHLSVAHGNAIRRRQCVAPRAFSPEILGVGLFLTPGALALLYSAVVGKGNIQDGFSQLITNLSQGYLSPDAGGKHIPVAEGDLSEFTGSYIGFLYSQYASLISIKLHSDN